MFLIRRVTGDSMLPTLHSGRIVVGSRFRQIKPGQVVIVRHDGLEKIKRVQAVRDGRIFIVGDNPAVSTDSRSFGWLPTSTVRATVVWPINLHEMVV